MPPDDWDPWGKNVPDKTGPDKTEPETTPEPYTLKVNKYPVVPVSDYGDAFDEGVAFALAYETRGDLETGAPHNVEGDAGGFTKFGIAQEKNKDIDVPNLTLSKAVSVYRERYWPEAAKIPESSPALRALYFEGYMNMGRGATKALQRAVGTEDDGAFGPKTKAALKKTLDEHGEGYVVRRYLTERHARYKEICDVDPDCRKFLGGWENRLEDVGQYYEDVLKERGV